MTAVDTPTTGLRTGPSLVHRPGRWIDNWNAEDTTQWNDGGKAIASRNLKWSIFAEFLGFVIWQLWSIVVVQLPKAGFTFDTGQIFWLISMPSLVGATLRFPYTFMVARFGGRNWTIISAGLLLIPSIALGICVGNPATPFPVMLFVAALAGLGGGNFASSMSNITYFYPQSQKGWALGLNAAGGNLGAAVAQLVVPIVITIGAAGTLNLSLAGWFWVPFILVAMWGAWKHMDNLSSAKADFAGSLAALREPHLWILALLYIGTFGSFIGFASVFPKLIADQFPAYSTFHIMAASISLAFLGALVGSLARPAGGKLADRFGGARVTIAAFGVMALGALLVIAVLSLGNFWLFLASFLLIFVATGVGNGSTYRMIPSVFAARSGVSDAHTNSGDVSTQRKTAAALGLISAIGAYGGFIIPQVLGNSKIATGSYTGAIYGFIGAYLVMMAVTAFFYLRRGSSVAGQRI
ncbi:MULTISPECIES: MFS transporter [Cryobacterium]|uniref:MFS transporter n=1 Tax=Cryobacterium glucosi TaxID=1259175 RepID=A0ABY2IRB3_9MICO|nr:MULTISPECIES: MFS transporter [Cryobacterium]MDY7527117.1 MFS transporter [Cryobacterium sp. 10C2]MDY7557095.1 MFS transporter [Cryobacterium sp. 10C3]MEB0003085.1 MFS transporter [Cryobacterium sp. RTC2.1]MEB0200397.1 MFS transporter [Cryobacterium sp. 5I3]MEB0286245.1 MFS transporter [Cryobacterium sp. 10S3]